jgi:hypothetical protein
MSSWGTLPPGTEADLSSRGSGHDPIGTTPAAAGVPTRVGRPRGGAAAPQGVELPAEEVDQVREGEGDNKEGAFGRDGGSAQRRAGCHQCAELEGPKATEGYRGTPCCSRGPC